MGEEERASVEERVREGGREGEGGRGREGGRWGGREGRGTSREGAT